MTFSFRTKFPERDAFTGSAICYGGVVRVRTSGRLPHLETESKSLNQVHPSVPFEPLPIILPRVAQLAASLRQQVLRLLRSQPFSSIVICMRELASVLLLRLSQSPRSGHGPNEFLGAFLKAPRSLTRPRTKFLQEPMRGPLGSFEVLSCVVSHVLKHGAKSDEEITKSVGEFPNV